MLEFLADEKKYPVIQNQFNTEKLKL